MKNSFKESLQLMKATALAYSEVQMHMHLTKVLPTGESIFVLLGSLPFLESCFSRGSTSGMCDKSPSQMGPKFPKP